VGWHTKKQKIANAKPKKKTEKVGKRQKDERGRGKAFAYIPGE